MIKNTLENILNNFSFSMHLFTFELIIINHTWYLSYCHSNNDTSRGVSKMLEADWLSGCLFMSSTWLLCDIGSTAILLVAALVECWGVFQILHN